MDNKIIDILIIGGGINGAGIAADAAGRGLSITLCEQDDLAASTSSASSKLIHGGLRYLEYCEFRLVREALNEREVLLKNALHVIHPLQFIMPHNKQLRPAWLIRLGLFLYDHLGHRTTLPKSHSIRFDHEPTLGVLKQEFVKGFIYSDCWTDDARLVVLNALQAKQKGANILTKVRFINAIRQTDHWLSELQNLVTGEKIFLRSRILINAAGPWVEKILHNHLTINSQRHMRLIKGSHIVVPRLYNHSYAYILQNTDKRIIFVIPYLNEYSLIGTTDVNFNGDLSHVKISMEEINYLCAAVNQYFTKQIKQEDIVWSYAGVRPLLNNNEQNPAAITRDYSLELNNENNAPLLSIFGGKITTYRKLAEHALELLKPFLPNMGPAWTARAPLPGGNIPNANFTNFLTELTQQYAWLPVLQLHRYAKNYGTLIHKLLDNCKTVGDLGQCFGADLYEREVIYLTQHEWAKTADDILWRRTKLGLRLTEAQQMQLQEYLMRMK